MKKNLALLLAGIMVASTLTACGGQQSSESTDAASTESSVATDAASTGASTEDAATSSISALQNTDGLETITLNDIDPDEFVTLGEYKGVTVEATLEEVTDDAVEEQLSAIFTNNPAMVEVTDRAVQDGDTVNIDYVGKYADSGEAFDGGTAEGATLVIGSNSYIDGFESGLVGANAGDTVDLNLTFPEDYGATELAGKDVVFTVTVNSISVASDEMTDEWAAGLGAEDVTDLASLRTYIRTNLETEAQSTFDSTVESQVLSNVFEGCEFKEVPEGLYNRYLLQQKEQLEYYASMYSMYYGQTLSADDIVTMMMQSEGSTADADTYFNDMVTEATQQFIMFAAIAKAEKIEVTEEEIDEYLQDAYNSASSTAYSTYEDYKATLDLEIYREGLLAQKVMDFLVENANVVGAEAATEGSSAEEAATEASSTEEAVSK